MRPCCWPRSSDRAATGRVRRAGRAGSAAPSAGATLHNTRMDAPTIRSALPSDEAAWRKLWQDYCDFYGARPGEEITSRTWMRILDPDSAVMCILAEVDSRIYGFANCVVHENTWEIQPVCYLEDLFVLPSARGHGIGRALVEWLRNAMRAEGWARLYWVTHEDNQRARRLYDQLAQADGFVRYMIKLR